MRVKKHIILYFIILLLTFSYAQQDFNSWLQKENSAFKEFKDQRDSAFVEFLRKEWQKFSLYSGIIRDSRPKPLQIPQTNLMDLPREVMNQSSRIIEGVQIPTFPLIKESESTEKLMQGLIKEDEPLFFSFFNAQIGLNFDKNLLRIKIEDPIDEDRISEFWENLSLTKYEDILGQSKLLKEQMRLNDWGYYLLIKYISMSLYPNVLYKQNLFTWFILLKSGFDIKIGYNQNDLFLLIPSKNVIYGARYLKRNEKNYYLIVDESYNKMITSIHTYDGHYPEAVNTMNMNVTRIPLIRQSFEEKKLKFKYGDEEFYIQVRLRRDAIDFYAKYPQTDYEVYFNSLLSSEAQYSLLNELKLLVEGRTEVDAANLLLRFVQTAFKYQNDENQFGYEKFFFAEETLFYPFSDCEDRSVLFTYLVRNLLRLEVVGLDYPGHIATAVKFNSNIKGDYIVYEGNKYVICDPTYINANIGQCIPRFQNINPKIIEIKNNY